MSFPENIFQYYYSILKNKNNNILLPHSLSEFNIISFYAGVEEKQCPVQQRRQQRGAMTYQIQPFLFRIPAIIISIMEESLPGI